MVWQMLLPDRERSDVENRTLQQRPALTLSSVLDGSYMEGRGGLRPGPVPLRDQWTGLKARTEQLIGKRLFNNIYLCEGETLISKVDAPADGLEKANLNYVSQLAEKSDIPMYLGLIPPRRRCGGTNCRRARSPGTRTLTLPRRRAWGCP